ncbi:hypothetical protein NOGI109294_09330 [Nocardiopsis gilva]
MAALRTGWSTGSRPAVAPAIILAPPVRGPVASIQYRSRWNAYVGRSTRRARDPANALPQSTGTPRTYASASDVANRVVLSSSRRSVSTVAADAPSAPMDWSRPIVSTGCALTSTNAPAPASSRPRTVSSKRTVERTLVYQYSASSSAVSRRPPVTVEWKAMSDERVLTPSNAFSRSSRASSTSTECDA